MVKVVVETVKRRLWGVMGQRDTANDERGRQCRTVVDEEGERGQDDGNVDEVAAPTGSHERLFVHDLRWSGVGVVVAVVLVVLNERRGRCGRNEDESSVGTMTGGCGFYATVDAENSWRDLGTKCCCF